MSTAPQTTPPSPAQARLPTPTSLRVTALIATLGTVLALVGLVTLMRPVTTPVQDCGVTIAFLLDGRVNVYADPANPPDGLTRAQVVESNDEPCRVRVADAARPGLLMVAAGTAAAVGALIVEFAIRVGAWSRRRPARTPVGDASGAASPPLGDA